MATSGETFQGKSEFSIAQRFSFRKNPKSAQTCNLTCKHGSLGLSEGLLIPESSVRFRLKLEISNSNGFELHRPSINGTKLLLNVIKTIIIIELSLLYILILRTHSKSLCVNTFLALGVCFPQTCLSAGRMFTASRSGLHYCRRIFCSMFSQQ